MSFGVAFLDDLAAVSQRWDGTTKVEHQLGLFLAAVAKSKREHAKTMKAVAAGGEKKLLTEGSLDGTVGEATKGLVEAVKSMAEAEEQIAEGLLAVVQQIDEARKKHDAEHKQLVQKTDAMNSAMAKQMAVLGKSKDKYSSLYHDCEKQQATLSKANADPSKGAKIGALQSKVSKAQEAVKQGEQDYVKCVAETNNKRTVMFTEEMPAILGDYQAKETDKIAFIQARLKEASDVFANVPGAMQRTADAFVEKADAIDVESDIQGFISSKGSNKPMPDPIEPELLSGGLGSSSPAPQRAADATPVREWGLSAKDQSLSDDKKIKKLEEQKKTIAQQLQKEEKNRDAMERMSTAYANDPVAKTKSDSQKAEIEARIAALRKGEALVDSQLAELSGGGAEEEAGEKPVLVRAAYDYDAQADTEISFTEGQEFYVTERDESGWWYATIDGKEGYIPANYVEVIDE